jgi:hypothetical protein
VNRATLLKQLDTLITWLECGDEERPSVFGSRDEYEWLLRLSGMVRSLLTRHRTDAHGRCRHCREPHRGLRGLVARRRMPCRVLGRADFFASSDLDVVWWQVLSLRGDDIELDVVRAWLDSSLEVQSQVPAKHVAVITDERVRPYYWGELPTGPDAGWAGRRSDRGTTALAKELLLMGASTPWQAEWNPEIRLNK